MAQLFVRSPGKVAAADVGPPPPPAPPAPNRSAPVVIRSAADVSDIVDDIHRLYLAVYDRSPMQFEKLNKTFFCEITKRMPDKVRYFVWRQGEKIIAFGLQSRVRANPSNRLKTNRKIVTRRGAPPAVFNKSLTI